MKKLLLTLFLLNTTSLTNNNSIENHLNTTIQQSNQKNIQLTDIENTLQKLQKNIKIEASLSSSLSTSYTHNEISTTEEKISEKNCNQLCQKTSFTPHLKPKLTVKYSDNISEKLKGNINLTVENKTKWLNVKTELVYTESTNNHLKLIFGTKPYKKNAINFMSLNAVKIDHPLIALLNKNRFEDGLFTRYEMSIGNEQLTSSFGLSFNQTKHTTPNETDIKKCKFLSFYKKDIEKYNNTSSQIDKITQNASTNQEKKFTTTLDLELKYNTLCGKEFKSFSTLETINKNNYKFTTHVQGLMCGSTTLLSGYQYINNNSGPLHNNRSAHVIEAEVQYQLPYNFNLSGMVKYTKNTYTHSDKEALNFKHDSIRTLAKLKFKYNIISFAITGGMQFNLLKKHKTNTLNKDIITEGLKTSNFKLDDNSYINKFNIPVIPILEISLNLSNAT